MHQGRDWIRRRCYRPKSITRTTTTKKDASSGKAMAYHVGVAYYPSRVPSFNCCNLLLDRNKTEENENDISSPRAPPCNCLVDNKCVVVVHTKASSSIHRLSSAIVVQIPVSSLAQRVNQQMPTMTMHRYLNQLRYYAEHNPKTSTAILTFGTALSCGKMHIFISMTI